MKVQLKMAGNNYAIFPVTTLEHETDHATRAVKDPIGFSKDLIRYSDPTYKYKEEKRVIQGVEMHTAGMNGEIPYGSYRSSHFVLSVRVSSPTSNGRTPAIQNRKGRRYSVSPKFL